MATYAVGDIQGCFDELQQLLEHIKFNPQHDQLWLCGDLVSRGPKSLQTLHFVKQLGRRAVTVLGNHDLHLLAIAEGVRSTKDKGLLAILNAPDTGRLLDWLRSRPLLHHDEALGYCMVHAGIYPGWTLEYAKQRASELQRVLQSGDYVHFLKHMYGNEPDIWSEELSGWDRLRFICNSFTRMRYCNPAGHMEFNCKGAPGSQPPHYQPWFELAAGNTATPILFGHWSTLGYEGAHSAREDFYALDTGCIWGGRLTALRIDVSPPQLISIDCSETCRPGKQHVKKSSV